MIVSINQPAYFPWLGYFHRIAASDLHVVLDHVQFEKNSFTNRNKIRTGDGSGWLTVPLKTKGRFGQLNINAVEIDNHQSWREKHWRTIRQNYGKSPHFAAHAAFFESVYQREWTLLADLCREITGYLLKCFGITTPLEYSSKMEPRETKSALVLELCQKAGAKIYLSGSMGGDYLDECAFAAAEIKIIYQDFKHPRYEQFHRNDFEPFMAAIDLLFNCGPQACAILVEGQAPILS